MKHPDALQYTAFGDHAPQLAFPDLGVRYVPHRDKDELREELRMKVTEAVRDATGRPTLAYDPDRGIVFPRGSAVVTVRVHDGDGEPAEVLLSLMLVTGVRPSDGLLRFINDTNGELASVCLAYGKGMILATTSVPAEPLVANHIARALQVLFKHCAGLGETLQERYGGKLPGIAVAAEAS